MVFAFKIFYGIGGIFESSEKPTRVKRSYKKTAKGSLTDIVIKKTLEVVYYHDCIIL